MTSIVPLKGDVAIQVARIMFAHLGYSSFRDRTKTSKRLKWEQYKMLPRSAHKELQALGVEIVETQNKISTWRPPSISFHFEQDFDFRQAVKGIPKPGKTKVRHVVSKPTILNKLLPYVMAEDDDLGLLELIQIIHDRIKEDVPS